MIQQTPLRVQIFQISAATVSRLQTSANTAALVASLLIQQSAALATNTIATKRASSTGSAKVPKMELLSTWRTRTFAFLSRAQQRYRAPRNFRSNQAHCTFYKLPGELHLQIAVHLSTADLLSYAHCSHRTLFLVSQLQPPRSAKADFAIRLRRDREIRTFDLRGIGGEVAWCSHHSTMHPLILFKPTQLTRSVSNADRTCVGVNGRFRVCEHRSYSPEELKWATFGSRLLCDQHVDPSEGIVGPRVHASIEECYFAVFTNSHVVLQVPFHNSISVYDFNTALVRIDAHICPHKRSSDKAVHVALQYSLERRKRRNTCQGEGHLLCDREAFVAKGRCEHCATEYSLRRNEGGGCILLDIQRRVRNAEALPNGVDELLHLEDCSDVHDA